MDQITLETALAELPIPAVRFFSQLDSTNNEAAHWADLGAPDLALVVADEQIAGRGRAGHRWITPPGAALAFSLILYPLAYTQQFTSHFTALGAIAVHYALLRTYSLPSQIKWPNDVLLECRKVAGVLAEASWSGDQLTAMILGIGINVATCSTITDALPQEELNFPATCVEDVLGHPVDRLELLYAIIKELLYWRPQLGTSDFLHAWESCLAFRGEWVQFCHGETLGMDRLPTDIEILPDLVDEAKILGLSLDGSLKLLTKSGEVIFARVGEIHLHPG
jgi:BirA family transcriptional regulator, biotin operon repressor / biotin---[acetyl-CoA-carboxylase] ligase